MSRSQLNNHFNMHINWNHCSIAFIENSKHLQFWQTANSQLLFYDQFSILKVNFLLITLSLSLSLWVTFISFNLFLILKEITLKKIVNKMWAILFVKVLRKIKSKLLILQFIEVICSCRGMVLCFTFTKAKYNNDGLFVQKFFLQISST